MEPSITITPKECMADEAVAIRIRGLRAHQKVTVHAILQRSDVGIFDSFAKYTATPDGRVDVTTQASIGGYYSGVEPMGLFWSMKPPPNIKRAKPRLIIRNVENPIEVSFRVFDSHLEYADLSNSEEKILTEGFAMRWYKRSDVKRITVRWRRVRGTVFVPSGQGPFPALIDLYGGVGGIMEYRASLFASRGYISLALAYFDYDDIPISSELDLRYFEEAKEYLKSLPETDHNRIGIVGNSLGGLLALACATYVPGFTCAVFINGLLFPQVGTLRYKDRIWPPIFGDSDLEYTDDGARVEKYCFDDKYNIKTLGNSSIEFAGCEKPLLFIFSQDDNVMNVPKAVSFMKKLIKDRNGNCEIVVYPGAGHLLEPPHFPHAIISYIKFTQAHQHWGGRTEKHAKAQELAWDKIMTFLDNNLREKVSKL